MHLLDRLFCESESYKANFFLHIHHQRDLRYISKSTPMWSHHHPFYGLGWFYVYMHSSFTNRKKLVLENNRLTIISSDPLNLSLPWRTSSYWARLMWLNTRSIIYLQERFSNIVPVVTSSKISFSWTRMHHFILTLYHHYNTFNRFYRPSISKSHAIVLRIIRSNIRERHQHNWL